MSSIVTTILQSTVSLLWNKTTDGSKLSEGDITDANIYEAIMGELNHIEVDLCGLLHDDLLNSCRSLREGVHLMNDTFQKSTVTNDIRDERREASMILSNDEPCFFNDASELTSAIEKLKHNSGEEFESSRKLFKKASHIAGQAFTNKKLSVEKRIFAAKLQIVSEIMQHLERPDSAIAAALSCLKRLHSLAAVQDVFSVYLNRGIKSIFNKTERARNIKSVMLINYVLFQFVWRFDHNYCSTHTWPTIQLAERSFFTILHWNVISRRRSMSEELTHPPNELTLKRDISPLYSAVNSHAQVIVGHGNHIAVISKTGERKVVKLPDLRESGVLGQFIEGVAVDEKDNVYVIKEIKRRTDVLRYVLYVLNENYKIIRESTLEFLQARKSLPVRMTITRNNHIIFIKHDDLRVFVCETTGILKHTFKQVSCSPANLDISEKNDAIMLLSDDGKSVHFFTEDGDLSKIIKVPSGHIVKSVAFHHVIDKIIVLTYIKKKNAFFLLYLTEKGEVENSLFVCERATFDYSLKVTSHPRGPVAVIQRGVINFL